MIKLAILLSGLVLVQPATTNNYLIKTPNCAIRDIGPWDSVDEVDAFKQFKLATCPKEPHLTDLYKGKGGRYGIKINKQAQSLFKYLTCSLRTSVWQSDMNKQPTPWRKFNESIMVPEEYDFAEVHCEYYEKQNGRSHDNIYLLAQRKPVVEKRFQKYKNVTKRAPSVLILAADGVGRVNLQRTMPRVFNYLRRNNFYDMKGFTKVWSRTFYNLMADLVGYGARQANRWCDSTKEDGLSNCPFIWNDFRENGYATAYMEDFPQWASFNHDDSLGFSKIPVDHYGRTALCAMEKIENTVVHDSFLCAGSRYITDYVYNNAIDFAKLYKGKPYFGLFFTNSMSHNHVTLAKQLEPVLLNTLKEVKRSDISSDSIVILLSDHGCRYNIANADQDINMPMLYISLPAWFKAEYPDAEAALRVNQHRLSSPFDLYLTLKDLLRRSGRLPDGQDKALGCKSCQSLLEPLSAHRKCKDVGVSMKYCMCGK